jgi:hypothetical protein
MLKETASIYQIDVCPAIAVHSVLAAPLFEPVAACPTQTLDRRPGNQLSGKNAG